MIKRYCAYYTNDLGYDYPADLAESEGGDLVQYADHAALIEKIKQAAERAHAEWCAGPEGKLENVRAISKAFDEVFSLCDEVINGRD